MAYHLSNRETAYELAAINRETGESIFVAMVRGSRSRGTLRRSIFRKLEAGDTRLDRVNQMIGTKSADWNWARKSADGIEAGDWSIRFTNRTGRDVDQQGEGRSIYQDNQQKTGEQ